MFETFDKYMNMNLNLNRTKCTKEKAFHSYFILMSFQCSSAMSRTCFSLQCLEHVFLCNVLKMSPQMIFISTAQ